MKISIVQNCSNIYPSEFRKNSPPQNTQIQKQVPFCGFRKSLTSIKDVLSYLDEKYIAPICRKFGQLLAMAVNETKIVFKGME